MKDLQDKVALITGGSKGIGYGIAEAFLKQGMKVAVTSRSLTNAQEVADELNKQYKGKALGIKADVRNYIDQQEAVRTTVEKFGHINVLIANAGLGHFGSIEDITDKQWKEVIDTNLTGVFYSIKSAVEELKKTKGYFISISSLAGTNYFAGGSAYNASKFGLTGFTQAVMLDLRQYGIKTTTIMPGSVATHFNGHTPNEEDAWKIQKEDLGQLAVDLLKMRENALPSKVEIRPTTPPSK